MRARAPATGCQRSGARRSPPSATCSTTRGAAHPGDLRAAPRHGACATANRAGRAGDAIAQRSWSASARRSATRLFQDTCGHPSRAVLRALTDGIAAVGGSPRVVRIRHTADTSFLGLSAAQPVGLGRRHRAPGQGHRRHPPARAAAAQQSRALLERADHRPRPLPPARRQCCGLCAGRDAGAGRRADPRRGVGRALPCARWR